MRVESLLVQRCDLVRKSTEPTGRDSYGRPIYGDIREISIPCRLDQIQERVAPDDTGNDILISNLLFLGAAVRPTSDMRVENVRDAVSGAVIVDGAFRVVSIHPSYSMRRLHHYEVTLARDGVSNGK